MEIDTGYKESGVSEEDFIKIITATHLIQYFTARIESVRNQLMIVDNERLNRLGKDKQDYLVKVAKKLHSIAEDVADYCNNNDMVEEIDEKLTDAALKYLQGKIS